MTSYIGASYRVRLNPKRKNKTIKNVDSNKAKQRQDDFKYL